MQLELWHPLMAILAAFRLVDLIVADTLIQRVRERFPQLPWQCVRCASVWAGIAATIFLVVLPWINWPLALSWLYMAYGDYVLARQETNAHRP